MIVDCQMFKNGVHNQGGFKQMTNPAYVEDFESYTVHTSDCKLSCVA
jgi:hypothetical protein